ncbi:phd finger domain protein [Grosmannia clavigera kw1407]|uniref:Phd finger domain protein n=1 Tax=Grosmannia clavigera (strain kw1407 / UAMH 11150) TaxID=655863 RepID=F0XQ20_GROCL|nr:phd finger domain protein [Grosmannia clavigera kw1407]EFX00670.1 phd finger domain protein [Grosmannia clavigera kw1407]
MAPAPLTPRRTATGRRRGRPPGSTNAARAARLAAASAEPPPKRRKYIPGGPGGGGRFVDEDGITTEVVTRGSGRSARTPTARRVPHAASSGILPRRERSTRTRTAVSRYEPDDEEQFSSAAAVAAAVVQSEGYKPREERGWEEFHPNLDIETTFMVFSADAVDGTAIDLAVGTAVDMSAFAPVLHLPQRSSFSGNGMGGTEDRPPTMEGSELCDSTVAVALAGSSAGASQEKGEINGVAATDEATGLPLTPLRRRLGRPTRDSVLLAAPTPKTPKVLPIHNQTPKEKLDLKLPSYRKTDRILLFEGKTFGRYVDKSMMNVGYQESDVYLRPEQYLIKASDANAEEDTETSQHPHVHAHAQAAGSGGGVGRVEYDMDEQDDKWLVKYNAQRKENAVEPITREMFEITITKIEKEWHALEKRIPKPNPKPPQTHRPRSSSAAAVNGETQGGEEQDSKCAICDDGDCENTNAIVFCDGCDLAVHQDCYGVPFIPEGQWLCRKCQLIGRGIPTCIFCPNTDGAFKQTNSSKWAHMLCAMWIPETSLGNTTFMEPVMDVEKVPKTRWRLTCYICRQKMGACIQCGSKACYQAFHVTCARRARLYLKMKNSQGALAVLDNSMILKAFCDRHCPPDYAKEHAVHQATREAKRHYKRAMRGRIWADSQASALQLAATHLQTAPAQASGEPTMAATAAGFHQVGGNAGEGIGNGEAASAESVIAIPTSSPAAKPMWKLPSGAPVIPQAVFDIVETALQRFMLRRRREFVSEACRYWTLKREARRGAALLKRLQLQMETFTSMELTRRNFAAMGPSGRSRLQRRIDFAEVLIQDLFQLRSLADDVVQRERDKLSEAELELDFVNTCYFPVYQLLVPVIEKASSYDKNVFRPDLVVLQSRLDERYYTNALVFVRDLCAAMHKRINQADEPECQQPTPTNGTGEGVSIDAAAASSEPLQSVLSEAAATTTATTTARDRKRLGKRILKSIQPLLEAAVRAEADITRVPSETLVKEMEALLEASVELQQTSITVSQTEDVVMADGEAVDDEIVVAKDGVVAEMVTDVVADVVADVVKRPAMVGAFLTCGVGTSAPLTPPQSHSGSVPGGSMVAVIGSSSSGDGTAESGAGGDGDGDGEGEGGDKDSPTRTLDSGGVPWYLDGFSLDGTTVAEEPWSGRETARTPSEELTELDDEAIKAMELDMEDSTITAGVEEVERVEGAEEEATAAEPTETEATADTVMVTAPTAPRRRNNGQFRKGTRSSARRR